MRQTAVVLACLFSVARRQNNAAQSEHALSAVLPYPPSSQARTHEEQQLHNHLPRGAASTGNRFSAYRNIFRSHGIENNGCAFTTSPRFENSKYPRRPCCTTAVSTGDHRLVGALTSSPPAAPREPYCTLARTPAVAALLGSRQEARCDGRKFDKVASRPWAVVFEVACDGNGTGEELGTGVDRTLRRSLGSKRGLRLLRDGGYRAATKKALNFLVVHDGMSQDGLKRDGGGSSNRTGLLGLDLGDCCWTVTGGTCVESEDEQVLECFSADDGSEKSGVEEVADTNKPQQAIKNLAPIVSTTEMFPATFQSARRQERRQHEGSAVTRFPALLHAVGKYVGRSIVRSRAKKALANNEDEPGPGARDSNLSEEEMGTRFKTRLASENPLLQVGVGQLFSPRDCDKVISAAQETNAWKRWKGDSFGNDRGVTPDAMSLAELPKTRALGEGASGEEVRDRSAKTFGVQSATSILLAEADNIFVCKVGMQRCDDATPLEKWPGSMKKGVKTHENVSFSIQVDGLRRNKSLVTFAVALSPDRPEWAVCLEQTGCCLRSAGQGTGVFFSGKLRHAVASLRSSSSQLVNSRWSRAGFPTKRGCVPRVTAAVFVLRGFASIRDPSVREDVPRWRWGSSFWNLDAPWIQDEDILDLAWIGGKESTSLAVDNRTTGVRDSSKAVRDEPPTLNTEIAMKTSTTAAEESVETDPSVAQQQRQPLRRMNSTLAHRYYSQGGGCEGMEIPVLDESGRPVIDLVPTTQEKSWPLQWARGRSAGGSGGEKDIIILAVLREKFPWNLLGRRRRQVGRVGLSLEAGTSPRMDTTLRELFGQNKDEGKGGEVVHREERRLAGVLVPPIKYVYVDPRYRGLKLGRRLFLEAMCYLAQRGFRFALIIVEDNGAGGLFGFYEEMGFVKAEGMLGIPRAMIAPIPPPREVLER